MKLAGKYNPWAVINKSTRGKKDQNLEDTKPSEPGMSYGPGTEEEDDRAGFHLKRKERLHRRGLKPNIPLTWKDVETKMRQQREEPVMSQDKNYWLK